MTVFFREEATPFYTALLKLAPKALLNSKKLFQIIIKLDVTIASTVGKLNKFFEGGEILLIASKREN